MPGPVPGIPPAPAGSAGTAVPGLGSGTPSPEVVVVSSVISAQNVATAQRLVQNGGTPFRACGPLYWK